MDFTRIDINDIAQYIDGGMVCFVHKKTFELVYFPDPDQFFDDVEEFWGKDMKKVDDNIKDYIKLRKMSSRNSFIVMEDYTDTIKDEKLQSRLYNALQNRKPFRNWKYIIDDTGQEREDWFKFKQARMELWVSCQLEADDLIIAEKYYARRSVVHKVAVSGISRVIYRVGDLAEGADWYTIVLNILPSSATEAEVIFTMDRQELVLQKRPADQPDTEPTVLVYWNTAYMDDIVDRLMDSEDGAAFIQSPEYNAQGLESCILEDPWGNAFGLIGRA